MSAEGHSLMTETTQASATMPSKERKTKRNENPVKVISITSHFAVFNLI